VDNKRGKDNPEWEDISEINLGAQKRSHKETDTVVQRVKTSK